MKQPVSLGRWVGGVLGALLVADALMLMADGLMSLGVTLPLVLGVALLLLSLMWPRWQRWLSERPVRLRVWRWGRWAMAAWLVSLVAFWAALARASVDVVSAEPPAAIVVLGAGAPNGRPSPTLLARLDVALAQAARYPAAAVVVSGGQSFSGDSSEAQVMGDYLRAQGLAAERIVQEERSTSTEENLRFSQPLLVARGVPMDATVRLVTSDFHTIRARWIARRAGYSRVQAVGAPTPLYVRYNAWLREYFAFVSGFVLREF
ncbi:YdcF family protein [Ideonella sp. DXS29W]|uniref:YdcF family protein n=1 Tax=Ideonella lacteola TaxID=2984193 RepID=A0ABU9BT79_9BURK